MKQQSYGPLTVHSIGIVMKEMVRRSIEEIRKRRFIFEAMQKEGYDGKMDDIKTDADEAAQKIYVKLIKENFPGFGIIAEENHLRVDCSNTELGDIYFTVDPLDGTKAYTRRQSHGIGTMISLILNGNIIAAYIGDVNTKEIYGYRPESDIVHRIIGEVGKTLSINEELPLAEQYLLLHERVETHSTMMQRLIYRGIKHGLFRSYEITGGSIGISTARVWKSEVGAQVFTNSHVTPWDVDPVMGISQKLGFICLIPDAQKKRFIQHAHVPCKHVTDNNPDMIIIHQSRLAEFDAWQDKFLI